MGFLKKFDARYGNKGLWQFVKFTLLSQTITLLQLLLANLLPFVFDGLTAKLPAFLQPVFDPARLFEGHSRYVIDGAVTWGYVLPFFLSNFLANIYGYFVNMKATFRSSGTRRGLAVYLLTVIALILFSTWLQGYITAKLAVTSASGWARTISAMAAGMLQFLIIFPLEKFVLFKNREKEETAF